MADRPVIQAAVEGIVDEAVVRRLVESAQCVLGPVYGKKGKTSLRRAIEGYNYAARHAHWLVVVDLDDESCAPALRDNWLPSVAPLLCFRVAVREVECDVLRSSPRRILQTRRPDEFPGAVTRVASSVCRGVGEQPVDHAVDWPERSRPAFRGPVNTLSPPAAPPRSPAAA